MALKDRIIELAYELKDRFSGRAGKVTSSIRDIGTQSDKTTNKLERNNTRGANSFDRLKNASVGVKAAIIGTAAVIAGVISKIGKWTQAAAAQERAETKLATSLRNLTGASDAQIQALSDQAAELQQLTGYGDEATISAQAQLATFKLTAGQIQKLTPLLLDMAESQRKLGKENVDVESTALALGKAFTSGVGSLSRYGVALTDAQKEAFKLADQQGKVDIITQALTENFGGLAEAVGKEYEGAVRRADAASGDLDETIGSLFTQNKAFVNFQNAIAKGWETMGEGIKGASEEIGQVITGVVGTINFAAQTIRVIFNGLQIVVKRGALSIVSAVALISKGLSKITFGDLSKSFEDTSKELQEYAEDLRLGMGEDLADIVDAASEMGKVFGKDLPEAAEKAKKAGDKVKTSTETVKAALDEEIKTANLSVEAHKERVKSLEQSVKDAQKALQDDLKNAQSVAEEFAALISDIRSGPEKSGADLDILDFDKQLRDAQQALREGDFDGAIDGARTAADTLREMRDSGKESGLVLGGLADKLANLANEASNQKVDAGEQVVKSAEERLKAMEVAALSAEAALSRLDGIKVKIDTDDGASLQNLTQTQAAMQQQAAANPVVQPVVAGSSEQAESQAQAFVQQISLDKAQAELDAQAFRAEASQPIVQAVQLDTQQARQELQRFNREAQRVVEQTITAQQRIFGNAQGNSFTDRPLPGFSEVTLSQEALRKGARR